MRVVSLADMKARLSAIWTNVGSRAPSSSPAMARPPPCCWSPMMTMTWSASCWGVPLAFKLCSTARDEASRRARDCPRTLSGRPPGSECRPERVRHAARPNGKVDLSGRSSTRSARHAAQFGPGTSAIDPGPRGTPRRCNSCIDLPSDVYYRLRSTFDRPIGWRIQGHVCTGRRPGSIGREVSPPRSPVAGSEWSTG